MKIIFDFNRTLFNPRTGNLYPGVASLLERLVKRHELFLISRNEPGRGKRIKSLCIEKYFRRIIFTDAKTEAVFLDLAGDTAEVMVVGDRLSEEIAVGNKLAYRTVYVKQGVFEESIVKPDFSVENIIEVERILKTYEK